MAGSRAITARSIQRFGVEKVRDFHRAYGAAVDAVERIAREDHIDCDFARNGRLKLASKPKHYDKLARLCELIHRSFDTDVRMLSAAEVRAEVGSTRTSTAVCCTAPVRTCTSASSASGSPRPRCGTAHGFTNPRGSLPSSALSEERVE